MGGSPPGRSDGACRGPERFSLHGRVALVTGASRGIGAAVAIDLASAGASVGLVARSAEALEAVAQQVRSYGARAVVAICDVTDDMAVHQAVERTLDELGAVDVLVNNAGGPVFNAPFLDTRMSGWERVMDLNLTSVVRVTQAVGAHMVERGRGSVINITSPAVLRPWPAISAYSAAKAAVLNLTQVLAQEWAADGVRVNAVSPGWIRTEINRAFTDDADSAQATSDDIPLGRWGEPDDVCGSILWLASDASAYVTGTHLAVDGGLTAAVPEDWRALRVDRAWDARLG